MVNSVSLEITLVYSPGPRDVQQVTVHLPPGSTLSHALQASGLLHSFPDCERKTLHLGIWGRTAGVDQPIEHGDRVEIYRPLRVDPKVARRERFASQGARTAGLFANKRAGSKAGY